MKYTIETSGPNLVAVVTPTMEALGEQPWCVRLYHNGTQIVSRFIEASSGLEAVTAAVEDWLKKEGINGTIKIS